MIVNASPDSRNWDAQSFCPCGHWQFLALESQHLIRAPITGLLSLDCPADVSGLIATVVVNAINGVVGRWRWPHVGVERFERLIPTIANCDAATAIMLEVMSVRIGATISHLAPSAMLFRVAHAMTALSFRDAITHKAAAAFGLSGSELRSKHDDFISTVATATPENTLAPGRMPSLFYCVKAVEFLSGQLKSLHEKILLGKDVSERAGRGSEGPLVGALARRARALFNYAHYTLPGAI